MPNENDFEIEPGMDGAEPVYIDTGDELDMGQPRQGGGERVRQADVRADPCVLFSEIKANDWRIEMGTAQGTAMPAVRDGGVIPFFDPVPGAGHSTFVGDQGGARSPFPFRAVRCSIELLCPPTPTAFPVLVAAAYDHTRFVPSHSQMWGDIINRGYFWLEYNEITILKRIPVSQIGAGGGSFFSGDSFGSTQNQQPQWANSFKLPDEMVMIPKDGAHMKAWITLNPADLEKLGKKIDEENASQGWGQPLAPFPKHEYVAGPPEEWTPVTLQVPFRGIRLNFWGQRLLNIRAGKGSLSQAAAEMR